MCDRLHTTATAGPSSTYKNMLLSEASSGKPQQMLADATALILESLNAKNPTGVRRSKDVPWTWLTNGETATLNAGHIVAFDRKCKPGTVFTLCKEASACSSVAAAETARRPEGNTAVPIVATEPASGGVESTRQTTRVSEEMSPAALRAAMVILTVLPSGAAMSPT